RGRSGQSTASEDGVWLRRWAPATAPILPCWGVLAAHRSSPSALRVAGGRGGLLLVVIPAPAAAMLLLHLLELLLLLRCEDRLDLLVHLLVPRPHRLPVGLSLVRLPLLVGLLEDLLELAGLVVRQVEPLLHALDTLLAAIALARVLAGESHGPRGGQGENRTRRNRRPPGHLLHSGLLARSASRALMSDWTAHPVQRLNPGS